MYGDGPNPVDRYPYWPPSPPRKPRRCLHVYLRVFNKHGRPTGWLRCVDCGRKFRVQTRKRKGV